MKVCVIVSVTGFCVSLLGCHHSDASTRKTYFVSKSGDRGLGEPEPGDPIKIPQLPVVRQFDLSIPDGFGVRKSQHVSMGLVGSMLIENLRYPIIGVNQLKGVRFLPVKRIVEQYIKQDAAYDEAMAYAVGTVTCAVERIVLADGNEIIARERIANTNNGEVFLSECKRYVVKVGTPKRYYLGNVLVESAVHAVLDNVGGASVHYHKIKRVDNPHLHASCFARILVTDYAGSRALFSQTMMKPMGPDVAALLAGTSLIPALAMIHSYGIIHGDIHGDNIVCTENSRAVITGCSVIDFGRAIEFVDPRTRAHIGYRHVPLNPIVSEIFLSPFELKGSPPARRDDMFRLAETLMNAIGASLEINREMSVEKIIQMKLQGPSVDAPDAVIPPVFAAFYQYTIELGFADQPDYTRWENEFIQYFRSSSSKNMQT